MGTTIKITPPGGAEQTILAYSKCSVTLSATNRSGSFSLILPDVTGDLVDAFLVGSDVYIRQNDHVFRGWVLNPGKAVDGPVKSVQLDGMCYTGRTQKIVVTENYVDQTISDIVIDLFTKYMPAMDRASIVTCDKVISIKFKEEFLFDCMERLCELSGHEWVIYEPLPEEIDPAPENSGWVELVELVPPALAPDESLGWSEEIRHRIYYPPRPSETLYPADDLYPG
jgi:hypothetical protein